MCKIKEIMSETGINGKLLIKHEKFRYIIQMELQQQKYINIQIHRPRWPRTTKGPQCKRTQRTTDRSPPKEVEQQQRTKK